MKYAHLVFFMCLAHLLTAQAEELVYASKIEGERSRYPDVKGSPYLFENEWFSADFLTREMTRIPGILARYNTYSGEFEVKKPGEEVAYTLQNKRFMRIEFEVNEKGEKAENDEEKLIFQASFHPRFKGRFVNLIYSGSKFVVFRDYHCIISDEAARRVGESLRTKEFRPREDYYLLQNGELQNIRLNKKYLIKLLGNSKELDAFFKKNKPDLKSAAGLRELFIFAETLE